MYRLALARGGSISTAQLIHALGQLEAECGTATHVTRMRHLSALERLGARGMEYSNQDFDVMSSALNFLDAVAPEHELRNSRSLCPACGRPYDSSRIPPPRVPLDIRCACCCQD